MDTPANNITGLPVQTTGINITQVIGDLLGKNPNHSLTLRLAERRITPDVIMTFDIRARGDGWTYPTPRGALRFKNANSDAPNKYAWIGDKRDTLLYGFDLREAIQQAGGDVWLVTEFDFFAMRSAGVFHVIAQMLGEGTVPHELPALLQSMGARTCNIAPDRDDQGAAWAQLVADRLTLVGIEVYARELPYPHQKKGGGDIGKLWQEYNRAQSFERYLMNLPTMRLGANTVEIKKEKSKPPVISEDRQSEIQRAKNEIIRALVISQFNSNGYSKNIVCRFHDEKKPSAALHRDFGLHCFKCGWKGWKELATVIGVEWKPSIPMTIYPENALGDELIQTMIKAGYSVLASVLETLYRAGWIPKQVITIKSLTGLGIPVSRARKAFEQMEGRQTDKRKKAITKRSFCAELTSFFLLHKEGSELNKNSKRGRAEGRPNKAKVLPNPHDLARIFGVKVTRYTRITEKRKLADWCAEVYAMPIDRDPGTYPRKELCKPLGISKTTAQTYDKRANVIVTRIFAPRVQVRNADELPDTPELKLTWLETDDGRRFSATKAGYARALNYGGRVWKVKQLANDYRRER